MHWFCPDDLSHCVNEITQKYVVCRNPNLVKCEGEAQHLEKWGFGVLRDSRMFRAR
jgi:hypothetical protein